MSNVPAESAENLPIETDSALDPREYLRLALAYKWVILGIATVVGLATVFWTINQPKLYDASCTIEYDPNPSRPLGDEVQDVGGTSGFWMNREFYATQNKIIASRIVAEMVVRNLGLNRNANFIRPPKGQAEASVQAAAQRLQDRTTIEQLKETRIVAIRVRDENPTRAAQLANAIADAYISKMVQDRIGSTVSALSELNTQLDTAQRSLDSSEMELFQFKQQQNILDVSMEHRNTTIGRIIEEYNIALTTARTKLIGLQSRIRILRAANREDPMEVHAPLIHSDPNVSSLRGQFRAKMAERESLLTRYGENHPKIRVVDGEIDGLRNAVRAEIEGLITTADAEIREAQAVEAGLRAELGRAQQEGHAQDERAIRYEQLLRTRENNAKMFNFLLQRTTETNLSSRFHVTYVRVVDRALVPTRPVSPNIQLNVLAGALGGLALGIAFAFVLTKLDRRVRTVEEAEAVGLTILGILPTVGENNPRAKKSKRRRRGRNQRSERGVTSQTDLIVHTQPQSSAAECCRTIRTNLSFMSAEKPIRAILVTSSSPAEGKTTVATSLAIALAQSGKRVLLVDSDLRRPRIHRTFNVSGTSGVTSVLVGDRALADVTIPSLVEGLDILPCGPMPPNPAELLHSARFRDMLNTALAQYDRVVFDSPPLGAVTDAAILAPQLDTTILVIKSQQTTRDAVISALRQLRDVKARVAGGVLNDVDLTAGQYGYGAYYYYYRREGYYTTDAELAAHGESRISDESVSQPPNDAE